MVPPRFYNAGTASRDTIRCPRKEAAPLVVVIGQQTGQIPPNWNTTRGNLELEHPSVNLLEYSILRTFLCTCTH